MTRAAILKHLPGQHDQSTHAPNSTIRPSNPLRDLVAATTRARTEEAVERQGRPLHPDVVIREYGTLSEGELLNEMLDVAEATHERAEERLWDWIRRGARSDPLFDGETGVEVYRHGLDQRLAAIHYVEDRIERLRESLSQYDRESDPVLAARRELEQMRKEFTDGVMARLSKHRPGGQEHDQRDHGKKGAGTGTALLERPTVEPAVEPERPEPTRPKSPIAVADVEGEEVEPQKVLSRFREVMEDNPRKAFVTWYSDEEAAEMEAVMTPSGGAGMLIKDHGDGRREGTALFSDRDIAEPGEGLGLLDYAVKNHGVNYAEAFGPVLPRLYETIGFEVTESMPFNEEFAPPDWNYEAHDHPNYYIMRLKEVSKMAEKTTSIDSIIQQAMGEMLDSGMDERMAREYVEQAYDVVGGKPASPIAKPSSPVTKHGNHNQKSHGRRGGGVSGADVDRYEEAYTKSELLTFEADKKQMTHEQLRNKYGGSLNDLWRAHDVFVRARRAKRGGFTKRDPVAKDRPGGQEHDQREHGKKKPGSGEPTPIDSRPKAPLEPAKVRRPAAPEAASPGGEPKTKEDLGYVTPPAPPSMSDQRMKSLLRSSLMGSSQKSDGIKMWAMARQEQLLREMTADPEYGPEYVEHVRQAMQTAGAYYGKGKSLYEKRGGPLMEGPYATEFLFDHIDGVEGAYTPEREAMHAEIISAIFDEADERGVGRDAKALFMGGLPGAGKSTALKMEQVQEMMGVNLDEYIIVNPDDIKERLLDEGMIPDYPGLSPMESAFLMHEESSKIAWDIASRAQTQGYNIVWDITMSSTGSVEKRITQLQDDLGPKYEMQGLFVDVKPETSVLRAMRRHKQGMESDPKGGRLVPPFVTMEAVDTDFSSKNRRAFEEMKTHFSKWTLTSTEGDEVGGWRDPVVLDSGQGDRWKLEQERMRRGVRKASSVKSDILAYAEGDLDFQSLQQRMAGMRFKKPSRFDVDSFGHGREGYSYSEEGTWDEVRLCFMQGLLTREEYLTILNTVISQQSAKPKSPSLAQFAQGGGSGGGLSGERPENPMSTEQDAPPEEE